MADHHGIYILGETFIRTLPTTFDYSKNKMELGINIFADGALIQWVLPNWLKFTIFLASLLFALLVMVLGSAAYQKYKRQEVSTKYIVRCSSVGSFFMEIDENAQRGSHVSRA